MKRRHVMFRMKNEIFFHSFFVFGGDNKKHYEKHK